MKKSLLLFFSLLFLACLFSCGGGGSSSGGGGGSGSAPAIANLDYSPKTTPYSTNAITLNIYYDYYDKDGDIQTITFYYYSRGQTVQNPILMTGMEGQTSGRRLLKIIFLPDDREAKPFGIFITDSGGRESNRLSGSVTVY